MVAHYRLKRLPADRLRIRDVTVAIVSKRNECGGGQYLANNDGQR